MTDKIILQKLKNIITPYLEKDYKTKKIKLESTISEDLGINSMDLIKITVDIEDTFSCSIKDTDMFKARSIKEIMTLIKKSL